MKDAAGCDNLRGAVKQALIRRSPNGATLPVITGNLRTEYIGSRSEPWELKHLSTRRNRKQYVIPQVVASERGKV